MKGKFMKVADFARKIFFVLRIFHRFFTNRIVAYIPCNFFRKGWYRLSGMKLSRKCQIDMGLMFCHVGIFQSEKIPM